MDGENSASRPESPKKKIKSNPASNSDAQPSDSTNSDINGDSNQPEHNSPVVNGFGVAPKRKERHLISIPDSSSERSQSETVRNSPSPPCRVQEEEVSSSENSVGKITEIEDLNAVCDSASAETSEKH